MQLKDNQKSLHGEVKAYFHKIERDNKALYDAQLIKEVDGEHGRIVERHYRVLPVSDWIKDIDCWQDVQSVVEVSRIREGKGRQSNGNKLLHQFFSCRCEGIESHHPTSLGNRE